MGKYTDVLIFTGGKMIYGESAIIENKIVFKRGKSPTGEDVLNITTTITVPITEFNNVIQTQEDYNSDSAEIDKLQNILLLPSTRDVKGGFTSFVTRYESSKFTLNYNNDNESLLNIQLRIANVEKKDHPEKTDHPKMPF